MPDSTATMALALPCYRPILLLVVDEVESRQAMCILARQSRVAQKLKEDCFCSLCKNNLSILQYNFKKKKKKKFYALDGMICASY
jgi:hypothetical protein